MGLLLLMSCLEWFEFDTSRYTNMHHYLASGETLLVRIRANGVTFEKEKRENMLGLVPPAHRQTRVGRVATIHPRLDRAG